MKNVLRAGVTGMIFFVLVAVIALFIFRRPLRTNENQVKSATPPNALSRNATSNATKSAVASLPKSGAGPDFQQHPFPVAHHSANFEWAAADGKDTNVIRQLAHTDSEYRRMLIENNTIFRRQLVYFTQGLVQLAQQAGQSGQSLKQITLPGLDGQEFTVDVTRTDFKNGGSKGQIYGQLPDRPDSMVTAAFANLREAFTIISPQDQLYLQAEAHEPNEVVVKSVDPNTYGTFRSAK